MTEAPGPLSGRRVLLIAPQPFLQWRGSPIRIGFNARALAHLGCLVDLLVMPVGEDVAIPGVRLLRCRNIIGARDLPIGPSPAKGLLDLSLLASALSLGRRNRYDVVHGVEEAGAIAVAVARASGGKVVFEKHSDPASYRRGLVRNAVLSLYRRVESFTIRRADAVIGTGPALVDQARAVRPDVIAHHVPDIPSSLTEADPGGCAAVRARIARPGEILALYVGSFAVYQGIDLLFESMPRALAAEPRLRFVVIGGSPSEIASRKKWLAQRGIEGAVTFTGKVPPDLLPNYLGAADILLSPRIAGVNTPLKLLDYLKAGRAIVATDNAANRLILDEGNSLLAAPDPASFAAAVASLADDEPRRGRLAAGGARLIETTYNFGEFTRRLLACYEELLTPA